MHAKPRPTQTDAPIPAEAETAYQTLDRISHAAVAKATSGLAPSVLAEAWMDWAVHMAASPGKAMQLGEQAMRNSAALWAAGLGLRPSEDSADRRFASAAWQSYPFTLWTQAFTQNATWWQEAMRGVHGVQPEHEKLLSFVAGLTADSVAPSNFAETNPDVLAATVAEQGRNLLRGAHNLAEDIARKFAPGDQTGPQPFEVGRNLAVTPGKVVLRNDLMELIQYAPQTGAVHPEPILIVPAWIMKFYILDLSAQNSLVRFLVAQGFTVFMISWKNPDAADRDLGMEDYRSHGVMAAIDAALAITKAPKLHAVGYCLGGTLLSIAAAAMGRDGDRRLASASFLAAQVDFTEAGPLRVFINSSEITLIEDMMAEQGFLSSDQMAGAFAMLRARDLIWAPYVRDYLLGKRGDSFDLMAWNADATRMPARMHSQYLRELFLNNDLSEGRFKVGDQAIAVSDIRVPMFVVGTEDDHVAPWQSVYKLHLFADTEITFVLTSGGHNAGIVSEPGHAHRHFRMATTAADTAFRAPEDWLGATQAEEGSWWIAFADWLATRSGKADGLPPMGAAQGQYAPLCDAPGTYVMQT
jgi:polyhydroxyalkanoate synthase subunit PhaC